MILDNPRFLEAASRLFDSSEVTPNTVVVNVNAPMPAGAVHVDIPSFRGADRDSYPIRDLQAIGSSGLFEPWRVVEAGAVFWLYDGPGGAYDFWPEGLDGRWILSIHRSGTRPSSPTTIGCTTGSDGSGTRPLAGVIVEAEISHLEDGGWVITDRGRPAAHFDDEQIRVSILWKARVNSDRRGRAAPTQVSPAHVVEIFSADLASRGVDTLTVSTSLLLDVAWLDLVHSNYVIQVEVAG